MNLSIENFNINLGNETTVWIPNKSGHDFSMASRYGTPEFVTTGLVNRFSIGYIARKWMACLIRSRPTDFVLVTSLTILTVVGAAIFGHLHHRINLLIFRNGKYIARTILFDQLKDSILQGEEV